MMTMLGGCSPIDAGGAGAQAATRRARPAVAVNQCRSLIPSIGVEGSRAARHFAMLEIIFPYDHSSFPYYVSSFPYDLSG
jgi:hypothetical protein